MNILRQMDADGEWYTLPPTRQMRIRACLAVWHGADPAIESS